MSKDRKILYWILKIGIAGEFLGHGILAITGKADWVGWMQQILRVDAPTAVTLLLIIGIMDVILGLLVLVKPLRPLLIWMAIWGAWTAFVRPLVHNFEILSWLDFIERFANWAAPLALYYLMRIDGRK